MVTQETRMKIKITAKLLKRAKGQNANDASRF